MVNSQSISCHLFLPYHFFALSPAVDTHERKRVQRCRVDRPVLIKIIAVDCPELTITSGLFDGWPASCEKASVWPRMLSHKAANTALGPIIVAPCRRLLTSSWIARFLIRRCIDRAGGSLLGTPSVPHGL